MSSKKTPDRYIGTVIIEKITETKWLVVFPNGEMIECASVADAKQSVREHIIARISGDYTPHLAVYFRGC